MQATRYTRNSNLRGSGFAFEHYFFTVCLQLELGGEQSIPLASCAEIAPRDMVSLLKRR